MLVKYKRNKEKTYYDSNSLTTKNKPDPDPRPTGPFRSCGDCSYPSHGFICYGKEGDCLRTHMKRISDKGKKAKEVSVK